MFSTAYKFIRFEKTKSMGILTAIIISIYLIGVELGMFFFLANIIEGVVENSNKEYADIFVVKKETQNINQLSPLDIRWVNQLRSIEGVKDTHGFVMANVSVKLPNGETSPAMILGSDYPQMALGPTPEAILHGDILDLAYPYTISTDLHDKKDLGYSLQRGMTVEINNKMAIIGTITKNAKGFSAPLLYTTTSKARYYSGLSKYDVNGIIVSVNKDSNIETVIKRINKLSPSLKAWEREKLGVATVVNVMTANNMGISFGTLIIFGIISGFFIIGLTLYSATYDRIKDYGTLKAIGASDRYITMLVLAQSLIYAIVGFLISLTMLLITKMGMKTAGLILGLSPLTLLFLFAITLIISLGSSYFSIKKLSNLEPSSVFR